ncbi:MAG: DUF3857 domain-containing protein [Candidatus Krumholzibacteriia bacterium]
MRNVTTHVLLKSILAVVAAALIAGSACGHSAPAAAAGTGWKEMQLRYPGSDAVVLYDSLVVTLGSDNHIAKRRHRAVMLFTDNAINRFGDPRILFNAATQDLTILAARVRMRDGRIVEVRKNAVNQTTPFALDLAPDYVDWQETVITHMGIEKGCVAELHYVIADKNPSPYLSGVEVFSAEDPTEERVLVVKLPPGMTLKSASLNGEVSPPNASVKGVWVWTVRDIPGRTPFDGGAWEGDYSPVVCYSTASDRQDLLSKLGAGLTAKSTPLPAAETSICGAVKDLATDEEKVLAVHRLAIGAVTGVHVPYALLAAPARDAARIYDSGYASPLDRAVLLAAMLRTAAFEPAFVLVSAGKAASGDVPAPELFSRIAVSVPLGDGAELLLDPAAPFEHDPSFALAGKTLAYLGPVPRLAQLPARAVSDSRSELALVLKPGKDGGFEGKGTAILKGAFSPYYLVRENENGLRDFLKKRVSGFFGGAELVSWNPRSLERNEAEIDFTFTVSPGEKKKGERLYLSVPKPMESSLSGIERVRLERSQCADAINIEPCVLEVSCMIEPAPGWKMVTAPLPANEENEIGAASVDFASRADGTHVFRKRLQLDENLVAQTRYADFRSLLRTFHEDRIVLERE